MGLPRTGEGQKSPSLKSVTYILQWWNLALLYLTWRTSKKYINHARHSLSLAGISIFSLEIDIFCYIKKYRCRLHFDTYLINFWYILFESLKVAIIIIVSILMMSAKLATLGLLKLKLFWNKYYDVINSVNHVSNKIL